MKALATSCLMHVRLTWLMSFGCYRLTSVSGVTSGHVDLCLILPSHCHLICGVTFNKNYVAIGYDVLVCFQYANEEMSIQMNPDSSRWSKLAWPECVLLDSSLHWTCLRTNWKNIMQQDKNNLLSSTRNVKFADLNETCVCSMKEYDDWNKYQKNHYQCSTCHLFLGIAIIALQHSS